MKNQKNSDRLQKQLESMSDDRVIELHKIFLSDKGQTHDMFMEGRGQLSILDWWYFHFHDVPIIINELDTLTKAYVDPRTYITRIIRLNKTSIFDNYVPDSVKQAQQQPPQVGNHSSMNVGGNGMPNGTLGQELPQPTINSQLGLAMSSQNDHDNALLSLAQQQQAMSMGQNPQLRFYSMMPSNNATLQQQSINLGNGVPSGAETFSHVELQAAQSRSNVNNGLNGVPRQQQVPYQVSYSPNVANAPWNANNMLNGIQDQQPPQAHILEQVQPHMAMGTNGQNDLGHTRHPQTIPSNAATLQQQSINRTPTYNNSGYQAAQRCSNASSGMGQQVFTPLTTSATASATFQRTQTVIHSGNDASITQSTKRRRTNVNSAIGIWDSIASGNTSAKSLCMHLLTQCDDTPSTVKEAIMKYYLPPSDSHSLDEIDFAVDFNVKEYVTRYKRADITGLPLAGSDSLKDYIGDRFEVDIKDTLAKLNLAALQAVHGGKVSNEITDSLLKSVEDSCKKVDLKLMAREVEFCSQVSLKQMEHYRLNQENFCRKLEASSTLYQAMRKAQDFPDEWKGQLDNINKKIESIKSFKDAPDDERRSGENWDVLINHFPALGGDSEHSSPGEQGNQVEVILGSTLQSDGNKLPLGGDQDNEAFKCKEMKAALPEGRESDTE